jgi:hypothetical protein
MENAQRLALARRLEADFPLLEETGCQVGIGVATGADRVFIGPYDDWDVEPDRKLPLVMTKDIKDGYVEWQGLGVINPFQNNGQLVNLEAYPRLKSYLKEHETHVRNRNVAKRNPRNWYRTIDRIYPDRALQPKLLIPDIKGKAHIVYESGRYYPHHNLYYVTSSTWDLKALQAVLLSGMARLFVSLYSTTMRGGYLRFQAQYLRRIRLPYWENVPESLRRVLFDAAESNNQDVCNAAVAELYRLSDTDLAVLLEE